jgi:hypothetical protein
MRVLIGATEIAGTLKCLGSGFRALGHDVTTVIRCRNPLYPSYTYDVNLSVDAPDPVSWPEWIRSSRNPFVRFPRGAINRAFRASKWAKLVAQHDLFVFVWGGESLSHANREFGLLKGLGKKIVSVLLGSDVRDARAFTMEFSGVERSESFLESIRTRSQSRQWPHLRNMRYAEHYSDCILSLPNQSGLALRPYSHLFIPADVQSIECYIPRRDIPVVVHAPSLRGIKGTAEILQILDQLRDEGIQFDLQLLESLPNEQILSRLRDADVVIDQLYLLLHGKLGVEAMASGCALATCNREDYEPYPPKRPIWHIDASNLYGQLKHLLSDKALRVRLAQDGRKYVESYHDQKAVANRILKNIELPWLAQSDHFPMFCSKSFTVERGDAIPVHLKRMTTSIVARFGLPRDVDPDEMVRRGLMMPFNFRQKQRMPRWNDGEMKNWNRISGASVSAPQLAVVE